MMNTRNLIHKCPCGISRNYDRVPAFVGNDYFCESGSHSAWNFPHTVLFYPKKNLPTATTDDIELRLCTSDQPVYDDVPIELIELYVQ